MKQKNKCDKCGRMVDSVRSKYEDGRIQWFCSRCFNEEYKRQWKE